MTNPDDVYAELDTQPEPPVNVRVEYWGGGEDPVELTYEGLDEDGLHHWVAVPTAPLFSRYVTLKVDALPPRTTISLKTQ